jgi:hypothetical protein
VSELLAKLVELGREGGCLVLDLTPSPLRPVLPR